MCRRQLRYSVFSAHVLACVASDLALSCVVRHYDQTPGVYLMPLISCLDWVPNLREGVEDVVLPPVPQEDLHHRQPCLPGTQCTSEKENIFCWFKL